MDIVFTTKDHPEANGRKPRHGEKAWTPYFPLENGDIVHIRMGKQGRDLMFGMLIADYHDQNEEEPNLDLIVNPEWMREHQFHQYNGRSWRKFTGVHNEIPVIVEFAPDFDVTNEEPRVILSVYAVRVCYNPSRRRVLELLKSLRP